MCLRSKIIQNNHSFSEWAHSHDFDFMGGFDNLRKKDGFLKALSGPEVVRI